MCEGGRFTLGLHLMLPLFVIKIDTQIRDIQIKTRVKVDYGMFVHLESLSREGFF